MANLANTFTNPEWIVQTNQYKIKVNDWSKFQYLENRDKSSGNFYDTVNVDNNEEFKKVLENLIDRLCNEGRNWFASPIRPEVLLKRLSHTFMKPDVDCAYGNFVEFTWAPKTIFINQKSFEIEWNIVNYINKNSVIPSNFIDFSEELEDAPAKTIIIQENELLENVEIPFDESQNQIDLVSSRAAMKQKVRAARLKAAIASMKAEKLAEKYFRRYGTVQMGLESDSELSFESDEESIQSN
jgi:hypothetical protein